MQQKLIKDHNVIGKLSFPIALWSFMTNEDSMDSQFVSEVKTMKKGLMGLVLCVCLSLTAVFGGTSAKTIHGGTAAGPQCDLPPALVEQ